MKNAKISEATFSDLTAILYLQKCCYLMEAEIYNDFSIPPLTQDLESIQQDFKIQTILKLECDNKIIGSVRGFVIDETCYIGRLIVDKEYQNRGLGKQLMAAIESKFKNAKRFELFTGSKSDKNLSLYNKLGYKEFKTEKLHSILLIYLEKY